MYLFGGLQTLSKKNPNYSKLLLVQSWLDFLKTWFKSLIKQSQPKLMSINILNSYLTKTSKHSKELEHVSSPLHSHGINPVLSVDKTRQSVWMKSLVCRYSGRIMRQKATMRVEPMTISTHPVEKHNAS